MAGTLRTANPISLYEIIVAKTNSDATSYEDPIQLDLDQMFTVTPVHDTDTQRDSGGVRNLLSVFTHAEVTIQAGGIPFLAMVMMMGSNTSTSGNIVSISKPTGLNNPYFGAVGVAPMEDGGYLGVGVMKIQLTADPVYTLDGNTNAFLQSEVSALAGKRPSDNLVFVSKLYDDLAAWQADKPADGAAMLAYMSA